MSAILDACAPASPVALLVIAVLLAMAGVANAAPAEPAREPAPPPASCRTEPASSWAALTAPPAVVPDLVPFQDYRTGLALTPGATGTGVRIADVEYEWLASHLDLAAKALPAAPPTGLPPATRPATTAPRCSGSWAALGRRRHHRHRPRRDPAAHLAVHLRHLPARGTPSPPPPPASAPATSC